MPKPLSARLAGQLTPPPASYNELYNLRTQIRKLCSNGMSSLLLRRPMDRRYSLRCIFCSSARSVFSLGLDPSPPCRGRWPCTSFLFSPSYSAKPASSTHGLVLLLVCRTCPSFDLFVKLGSAGVRRVILRCPGYGGSWSATARHHISILVFAAGPRSRLRFRGRSRRSRRTTPSYREVLRHRSVVRQFVRQVWVNLIFLWRYQSLLISQLFIDCRPIFFLFNISTTAIIVN